MLYIKGNMQIGIWAKGMDCQLIKEQNILLNKEKKFVKIY